MRIWTRNFKKLQAFGCCLSLVLFLVYVTETSLDKSQITHSSKVKVKVTAQDLKLKGTNGIEGTGSFAPFPGLTAPNDIGDSNRPLVSVIMASGTAINFNQSQVVISGVAAASASHMSAFSPCNAQLCGSMFALRNIDPDTPELLEHSLNNLSCPKDGGRLYLGDVVPRSRNVLSLYPRGWRGAGGTILVTQLKAERLKSLYRIITHWSGPVIAVVYTRHPERYYYEAATRIQDRHNVLLLFVFPGELLYPINWLRNLGMLFARPAFHAPQHLRYLLGDGYFNGSNHVFVMDVDFVPSDKLYERITDQLGLISQKSARVGTLQRAFVVPAFELRSKNVTWPGSKPDLKRLTSQGLAGQFHEGVPYAHKQTNYKLWFATNNSYKAKPTLCHRSLYEPYVVISSDASPYFPEVFIQRRFNKVAYVLQLCVRRVQLHVIPDGFLIHVPHERERLDTIDGFNPCVEQIFGRYKKKLLANTEWETMWKDAEMKKERDRRRTKEARTKQNEDFDVLYNSPFLRRMAEQRRQLTPFEVLEHQARNGLLMKLAGVNRDRIFERARRPER